MPSTASHSWQDDLGDLGRAARPLRFLTAPAGLPCVTDPAWAPRHTTVAMAQTQEEASAICQLRYRVYVHEQGKRPEGIDWERGELTDPLDASSYLWYAREDDMVVGTVMQTMIGPDFDLSRLPAALELETFPLDVAPVGYSGRFAIAPERRGLWILPSLARHSYVHGHRLGGKFDFLTASPGRVAMFERIGYVRYADTPINAPGIGLLIPMVLLATDHSFLRSIRSPCLAAAERFPDEPQWRQWLRATRPIIDVYHSDDHRRRVREELLIRQAGLPAKVAEELDSLSFVQHFSGGTVLQHAGDRVTCVFLAAEGKLVTERIVALADSRVRRAPDGVVLADTAIHCETDAVVLCVPTYAIARLHRRHPEQSTKLSELLGEWENAQDGGAE